MENAANDVACFVRPPPAYRRSDVPWVSLAVHKVVRCNDVPIDAEYTWNTAVLVVGVIESGTVVKYCQHANMACHLSSGGLLPFLDHL